jgi:hypothetical protein
MSWRSVNDSRPPTAILTPAASTLLSPPTSSAPEDKSVIYRIEDYCKGITQGEGNVHYGVDSNTDKITMAMMLASSCPTKVGVEFNDIFSLLSTAQSYGCLELYVNIYGQPVSYVIWGYCDHSPSGDVTNIWFENSGETSEAYLIDYVIKERSTDDTIFHWTNRTNVESITVCRNGRTKKYRRYSISRIRQFPWRVSLIGNTSPYGSADILMHHQSTARDLVTLYGNALHALNMLRAATGSRLDVSRSLPLAVTLQSLNQFHLIFENNTCKAAIAIAFSDATRWTGKHASGIFDLSPENFTDGPDIIIADLFGDAQFRLRVLNEFLSSLERMGEREVYVPNELVESVISVDARWSEDSREIEGLVRLVS